MPFKTSSVSSKKKKKKILCQRAIYFQRANVHKYGEILTPFNSVGILPQNPIGPQLCPGLFDQLHINHRARYTSVTLLCFSVICYADFTNYTGPQFPKKTVTFLTFFFNGCPHPSFQNYQKLWSLSVCG